MRRYTLLVWGSIVLSASALAPTLYSAAASAADRPAGAPGSSDKAKMLNTVPEDGGGDDDFPASSRLVRDIVAARPTEDLIICIAGCRPGADRVVYAQPFDPIAAKKPAVAAEPAPVTAPAAAAAPAPEADKTADSKSGEKPADAQAPATEPAAAEAEPETKGQMEPTAAQPEASSETSSEAPATDTPSEGSSDEPPSEGSVDAPPHGEQ